MNSCAGVASKSQASSDGFLILFFADRDYSSNASNNRTFVSLNWTFCHPKYNVKWLYVIWYIANHKYNNTSLREIETL